MLENQFGKSQKAPSSLLSYEKYIEFLVDTLHVSKKEIEETIKMYKVHPSELVNLIKLKKWRSGNA